MGIFDMFTGDPLKEAADAKTAGLNAGYAQLSDLLGQARGAVTDYGGRAIDTLRGFGGDIAGGLQAYLDAVGAAGTEGFDRARTAFNAMVKPDIDRGVDAMTRLANARGVAVGNNMADAGDWVAKTMQGAYRDYVGGLRDFLGAGERSAGNIANLYTGEGSALAGLYGKQGQSAYDTQVGIGQNRADAAMADYIGSQNLWNFGLEAAKTAAKFTPWGAAASAFGDVAGGVGNALMNTGMANPLSLTGGAGAQWSTGGSWMPDTSTPISQRYPGNRYVV